MNQGQFVAAAVARIRSAGESPLDGLEEVRHLPELRPHSKQVEGYITNFDISPTGQRALVVARGEVFTIPKADGPTRNLTNSSGARDKDAVWSPDGA